MIRRIFPPIGIVLPTLSAVAVSYLLYAPVPSPTPSNEDDRIEEPTAPVAQDEWVLSPPTDETVARTVLAARPLFAPNRMVPSVIEPEIFVPDTGQFLEAEEVPPDPGPIVEPLNVKLSGILMFGMVRQALIITLDTEETRWAEEGATFGSWTLTGIHPDTATFEAQNETRVIKLFEEFPVTP